jgi:winged helix DNA-binding protein
VSISWSQALSWRLSRQLLEPAGHEPVEGVVRRLGAVPSMDESLAELAVRLRRTDSEPGELRQALADGRVVKVFAFRGSMNYLSPDDGGAYLALRAAGRQWELPSWQEYYRLSAEDWPAFRKAVREALSDGPLTIAELGSAVCSHRRYRHLRPVFDDGAGTLIKPLTWQGDMGFGLPRDGHHTFQRLDRNPLWAGIPDLDEAGRHAVTTYLRSYGPASYDGLHYWLGEGLSAGRKRVQGWLADLTDRLVEVEVEGESRHVLREDLDDLMAARPSRAVHLLPGHDQWVMGPGTKDEHVTPAPLRDLVTRKANPVTVGGVVSGTWSVKGDDVRVTWLGAGRLPRTALTEAVDRLGAILERGLRLTLST